MANILGCLLTFTLGLPTTASAFNIVEWLENPPYENGGTIKEQIQCYALPFGGIGFASHALTYLTVLCLATGHNPLMPWKRLKHRTFNLVIAFIGLLITLPLTVLTMVRCRNSWQFILIAVWKLVLSVTLSIMSIHAASLIKSLPVRSLRTERRTQSQAYDKMIASPCVTPYYAGYDAGADHTPMLYERSGLNDSDLDIEEWKLQSLHRQVKDELASTHKPKFHRILWWAVPYFLAAIVGFTGIMDIVKNNFGDNWQLRTITYVFAGVSGGIPAVVGIFALCGLTLCDDDDDGCCTNMVAVLLSSFGLVIFMLTILFAFYSDWVLAALTGDLVGWPSSDNSLFYWTYFAAKRLPMLSF